MFESLPNAREARENAEIHLEERQKKSYMLFVADIEQRIMAAIEEGTFGMRTAGQGCSRWNVDTDSIELVAAELRELGYRVVVERGCYLTVYW